MEGVAGSGHRYGESAGVLSLQLRLICTIEFNICVGGVEGGETER